MGEFKGGLHGFMIGRTGPTVGRRIRGKNISSMRPIPSNKPKTAKQLLQQEKMGMLFTMMNKIKTLLEVGFMEFATAMSPVNAAVKYNYRNVIGTAGNVDLDYAKFKFSRGLTGLPANAVATAVAPAKLKIDWELDSFDEDALETDRSYFLVYNPVLDRFLKLYDVVPRSALTFTFAVPGAFIGDMVHVYMCFVSAEGRPGDSFYLGVVEVV